MKREHLYRIFYIVSAVLLLAFIILIAVDHRMCYKCDPAYFFILLYRKVMIILLPALLCFILGVYFKHHYNR